MAVDVPAFTGSRARAGVVARIRATPGAVALTGIILTSFVARFAASIPHSTPRLFPDEYIYATLARSLAHGQLTVRGHAAHFPAVLEPVLSSPFWLFGDVESAFRLTQALHALVASLIAVPVYLLARRLGLPTWQRLLSAAYALVLPSLVYVSYLTADALGVTLATTAAYAAVCALEKPTRRSQLAFLVLAALASLARVQYVVLFAAFAAAALVVTGGNPLSTLRRYRVMAGLVLLPIVGALVLGIHLSLGYYHGVLALHLNSGVARWGANDAMLLIYSSGYVLVPGALVGFVLAVTRASTTRERAFGVFAAALAVLLFAEAALYAANGTDRFQERYLMALPPLVPILFCLSARQLLSRRARLAAAMAAVGFVIVAARVPLSGYTTALGMQDSPLLQAVRALERLTSAGTGSLMVALAVVVLTLPALLPLWRPRVGVPAGLASALLVLCVASIGATATDVQQTRAELRLLPTDIRWVDNSGLRNVSVLVTPSSFRPLVSAHLFWNPSLTRLLQMRRGSDIVDAFGYAPVRVLRDGTILASGHSITGPILVEEYADVATLENARLVRTDRGVSLWRATGPVRLTTLTFGRYMDGWLSWPRATLTVWPHRDRPRRGVLCLGFSVPPAVTGTLRLQGPGISKQLELGSGERRVVALPVTATDRPWRLSIGSVRPLIASGGRPVTVQMERQHFVERNGADAQAATAVCR